MSGLTEELSWVLRCYKMESNKKVFMKQTSDKFKSRIWGGKKTSLFFFQNDFYLS